jgi:hypothetical protein
VLHVSNGDAVSLRESGVGGEVVFWRDLLHDGPVPSLPLRELSQVRARFIAETFGLPETDIARDFETRDAAFTSFRNHDEVVLWFEHDLYDQLQLIQILAYLADQSDGNARISLIQADTYLGPLPPARLAALFPNRVPVTEAQFALARQAWEAFTAPGPGALLALARSDTSALPYLRAALLRHLEQFPSTSNGLNRTERQLLQTVAAGAATIRDAFLAVQEMEDPVFLGDSIFEQYAHTLANCREPLLLIDNGAVHLTPTGNDVLAGRSDHVALNGADRWLGGIHLAASHRIWRWDGTTLIS